MSLRWKSAILVFCVSLVVVPLLVEFVLRSEHNKLDTKASSILKQDAAILFDTLEDLNSRAYKYEYDRLKPTFDAIQSNRGYKGVYLYNTNNAQNDLINDAELPESAPGIADDCNGEINSGFICLQSVLNDNLRILILTEEDHSPASYKIFEKGHHLLFIIATIFLLTLAGFITGRSLAKKVEELVIGISKAGGGNYSQRIIGNSNDELGQLVTSYNRMLDNLQLSSQEIKEQLQNYKSILDTAAEGIISINDRGIIQEFNQSAERIFGYKAKEIIGKNITTLIPSKITTDDGGTLEQLFTGSDEREPSREVIGVRKSEQNFPMELSVSESTINNSQIYTGIIRDISERKKAANKQKSLEMQLRKLQRQETLESLSGGIAHDFNNILGPVLGYADMALEEAEEGTRLHKYLSSILKGAHKARELISRIMTFSRQSESSRENLHLVDIVEEAIELLKSSLPSGHGIKTYYNTERDVVAAEKTQLSQVLMTIANNASQAMENQDGEITIRVDNIIVDEELLVRSSRLHAGSYVRLRVEDEGIGMDTATLERVFEPFFSTRHTGEGSGLGLSVAYGIVSNFGGEILVDSEPGKGSVFTVLLPSNEGIPERANMGKDTKPISQGGELILYIDDDAEIAELGKEMLENLGYQVAISTSSEDALEMFRSDPEDFDVIITDQSMPVLTGTQLARELKRVNPRIPIILVTGFSASMLNQELLNSGINHCIAKPVVADELGRAILQVLADTRKS